MEGNRKFTWLLSDQVNSTTVTAAANGSFLAEIRYTSFGERRYASGQWVTDKLYTGQQQETEIGLDYYVARFYDPVLAHFIQPDSIIPSAGSTQWFDRYAYVMNNPVNLSDPGGHRPCDGADGCETQKKIISADIINMLWRDFSWRASGELTTKELGQIYGAGSSIRSYVDRNGGNGGAWIKKNLGYTLFEKNEKTISQANTLQASAFVWPYNTVRIGSDPVDSGLFIHELGHVLENNQKGGIIPATVFGGGPGDKMVREMGGQPGLNPLRMAYREISVTISTKPTLSLSVNFAASYQGYYDRVAGSSRWSVGNYANNGISDDIAQTFRYTITGERTEAQGRIEWMEKYISSLQN